MRVRFSVPIPIYTSSASAEAPQLVGGLEQETLRVTYALTGDLPALQVPPENKYIKQVDTLALDIEDTPGTALLANLVAVERWEELLGLLVRVANEVIRGIRNFGTVAHVREIRPIPGMPEQYIRRWKVEMLTEGEEYTRVLPDDGLVAALSDGLLRSMETRSGELQQSRWPSIVEAVERHELAPPELEFATNAIEHAQNGNLRLAIVEAVVCLEIVVTQYLKLRLEERGLSRRRIGTFTSPQTTLGIHSRVAYLLDLAGFQQSNAIIEEVMDTIEWRNTIVHRTGNLPEGKTEEQIRKGIASVLTLASLLGIMRDEVAGQPIMRQIGERIAADLGGRSLSRFGPVLKARRQHRVSVEFPYLTEGDIPTPTRMAELVDLVSRRISETDPDFVRERHLFVRFVLLPNRVKASWFHGQLTLAEE